MELEMFKNVLKGGTWIFVIVTILIGAVSGFVHFTKTGDSKPMLDKTLGVLINGDNEAYKILKDMESGKLNEFPSEYREIIKDKFIEIIFRNIIITLIVLYGFFKLIENLAGWNQPVGSKHKLLAFLLAFVVYGFVSLLYFIITTYLYGGGIQAFSGKFMEMLLSGIPLKSLFYGSYILYGMV